MENNKSVYDEKFYLYAGHNDAAKDNFATMIEQILLQDYRLFNSKQELLEQWPTVEDATCENELFYELEDVTDRNDFLYYSFYAVVDLMSGSGNPFDATRNGKMTELIYYYLLEHLPE